MTEEISKEVYQKIRNYFKGLGLKYLSDQELKDYELERMIDGIVSVWTQQKDVIAKHIEDIILIYEPITVHPKVKAAIEMLREEKKKQEEELERTD